MSTCSTSETGRPKSFKDHGFEFIDLRPAHLDLYAFVLGDEAPEFADCVGRTMVDRNFMPMGFCLAWFRKEGSITIHAYYGKWLKTFPKDILRGMKPVIDALRTAGVVDVYAVADVNVEGSDTLVKWFGGVPTGQIVPGQGEYYRVNILEGKI